MNDVNDANDASDASASYHVRRIRSGEGERLRTIRLLALRDAPRAFASTFEVESKRPAIAWEDRARGRASGNISATFVAETGDDWVGLVGAVRDPEEPRVVELVSMWVAPAARRSGVGARLVEEVLLWAGVADAERVELWVTRGNDPAIALYRRAGFSSKEDHRPSPTDPCREEVRMVVDLEQSGNH